jgi:hypothetical protein
MTSLQMCVIGISEILALLLIWRLWRTNDHIILKLAISVVALIPVLGLLLAYWASDFPEPHHPALRDSNRYSSDVYDRWHELLRMTDLKKRQARWKEIMGIAEEKLKGKE